MLLFRGVFTCSWGAPWFFIIWTFFLEKFKRKCFAVKLKIIQISSPISNLPPSVHPVDGINALNYFFFKLTIYLFFFLRERWGTVASSRRGDPRKNISTAHRTEREEREITRTSPEDPIHHGSYFLLLAPCSYFTTTKKFHVFFLLQHLTLNRSSWSALISSGRGGSC